MPSLPQRPFLYPVVDLGVLGSRGVGAAVADIARGGARIVQFRAKGLPDGRFLAEAREALLAARCAGILLLVNDRPDVARILGADGVHVGQDDLAPRDVRALMPAGALVGLSTHSLEQLRAAYQEPVDYVAVGPVFPTPTKAKPDAVVGLDLVRKARSLGTKPLVAIGGIRRGNVRSVLEAGADGIAVISDLLMAADLEAAVSAFQAALGRPE